MMTVRGKYYGRVSTSGSEYRGGTVLQTTAVRSLKQSFPSCYLASLEEVLEERDYRLFNL